VIEGDDNREDPMAQPSVFLRCFRWTTGVVAGCLLVMTSCAHRSDSAVAEQLVAAGRWDEAVAAYRQAVKKDPLNQSLLQQFDQAKARAAEAHYSAGREHASASRLPDALQEFKVALGLNPSRPEHHAALGDALRLKEAQDQLSSGDTLHRLGRLEESLTAYERAVELDPSLDAAVRGITKVTEQQQSVKTLGGSSQPITLRFQNAKLKEVFEVLARAGGINVLFDKEVRDEPITIFIKDTPFEEALNLILSLNGLFAKRVGPDTLLLMPNTKAKLDQYQDLMIRTYYLSNAKAKEMVNLVRTMLESKRVYVNEQINALVIRDTPVKLQLADRIIQSNDRREAEVELDVEILEVNRTKSQQFGLSYATTAAAGFVPAGSTGGMPSGPTTFNLTDLTHLNPSSYLFSLPSSLLLNFFKQDSDAKTLASPKLRVLNNKTATVNIGDKQPILLSTTNVLPGQAATGAVPTTSTVTSIEFKDTGVKLSVEPNIHLNDEVTLKLKVEVTKIGDLVTLQTSPEIKQFRFGTRMAETTLNLKSDEAVVLAGLIQDEDRKTKISIPGIGDIPVLGKLFSSTQDNTITTEVVLTITPHIVRNVQPPPMEAQAFWSGTEAAFATAPLYAPSASLTMRSAGHAPLVGAKPLALDTQGIVPAGSGASPVASARPASVSLNQTPVGAASSPVADKIPPSTETAAPRLLFQPSDITAEVGKEFRVDLTAEQIGAMTDALVTISFDPHMVEFHRAVPVGAGISSNEMAGQVTLTISRSGQPATGNPVLASLLFQAKARGSFPVTIRQGTASAGDRKNVTVVTERALVHAH
jgi:general secretion pathway protein D